jgi:hypothetical protein
VAFLSGSLAGNPGCDGFDLHETFSLNFVAMPTLMRFFRTLGLN